MNQIWNFKEKIEKGEKFRIEIESCDLGTDRKVVIKKAVMNAIRNNTMDSRSLRILSRNINNIEIIEEVEFGSTRYIWCIIK